MSPADVAVLGSFMLDHSVYVSRRPEPGETVRASGFHVSEGGKGFNQAVAAVRAGATVRMLGRLGDDAFGRRFMDRMRQEGIDTAGVESDPDHGTGVGLPVVDASGENAIVIVPGANDHVTAEQLHAREELVADAKVLLLQREIPEAASVCAARIAHDAGVFVILNPAPAGPVKAFRGLVDLVIPNEVELAVLAPGHDIVASARALAADLQCEVIVTLGRAGVLIVDRDGSRTVTAESVVAVDTTGAGDTFCGGLAARLAGGYSLGEAAEYAVVAAGMAVARRGGAGSAPALAEVIPRLRARRRSAVADGECVSPRLA